MEASSKSPSRRRQRDVEVLTSADRIEPDDDTAWAERAQYWESLGSEPSADSEPFNAPRVEQPPLVLNGHGVRLHIHNGCLVIRNGFTHYPQQNPELRFFPEDRKLPSRIIALDNDGSITFDVIAWLVQQRVPLVLVDWRGRVVSMVGEGSAYDPDQRQKQIEAQTNGAGLELATRLIREKVEGEQETLFALFRTPVRDNGLRKLEAVRRELDRVPDSFDTLRLIEARDNTGAVALKAGLAGRTLSVARTRKSAGDACNRSIGRQCALASRRSTESHEHAGHRVEWIATHALVVEAGPTSSTTGIVPAEGRGTLAEAVHTCLTGGAVRVRAATRVRNARIRGGTGLLTRGTCARSARATAGLTGHRAVRTGTAAVGRNAGIGHRAEVVARCTLTGAIDACLARSTHGAARTTVLRRIQTYALALTAILAS